MASGWLALGSRWLARFLATHSLDRMRKGAEFVLGDLLIAESEDLEKRERLLRLLVRGDVLNYSLGLSILRDNERLAIYREFLQDLGRIGFEIANGLDLSGVAHRERTGNMGLRKT